MIWLDVTKSAGARHFSGLTRVTSRLRDELGASATPIVWKRWSALPALSRSKGPQRAERLCPEESGQNPDWFLTAEVFAPAERPGFADFLRHRERDGRPMRFGAIYHDAIPLRLPHITWPQAVARHPAYMTMLADFDRVWAVSEASRAELIGFWKWQGRAPRAEVNVLSLGADFAPSREIDAGDASVARGPAEVPMLLCVGIIEPRKRQDLLLTVCERLWSEGPKFELCFVGRVNPHFGKPIERRLRQAGRGGSVRIAGAVHDAELAALYHRAAACVFPTIAEGCGLPLLEALWQGAPCIASDLPSLRENAEGGGCMLVKPDDPEAWSRVLRDFLSDAQIVAKLRAQAIGRRVNLPKWTETAQAVMSAIRRPPEI